MTKKRSFRLVVCIDVNADSLESAYEQVYRALGKLPPGFEWESSDEAYDEDGDGQAVDEDVLSAARMAVLDRLVEKQ